MLKTPKEIAIEYGFSVSHIRKLICQGHIKAEKLGQFYAIDPESVKGLKRKRQPNIAKKDLSNGSDQ
jgi:FAD synthase